MTTILITGAGSGFGRLAAFELARRGHHVVATTETWSQVTSLRNEAADQGLTLDVDKLNVTVERDLDLVRRWDVDVFISNAGAMQAGPIAELPMDLLREMFEVNFFGNVALTQRIVRRMVERRTGRLVFISSVAGLVTIPYSAGYSASKHAIESLAEGLGVELAPFGVTVATVNPGFYATGFNDRGTDSAFHWYDPLLNFTPPEAFSAAAEMLAAQLPPQPLVDLIVDVALADDPARRNVLPVEIEAFIRAGQAKAWGDG